MRRKILRAIRFALAATFVTAASIVADRTPTLAQSAATPSPDQKAFTQNLPRVQSHLRKLFGNPQLRVVAKDAQTAWIYNGDQMLGRIEAEDENFGVEVLIPPKDVSREGKVDYATVEQFLRSRFGSSKVRVNVKNGDNVELRVDDESFGSIYSEDNSLKVMASIWIEELGPSVETLVTQVEPLDSTNSVFFTKRRDAPVYESPTEESSVVTRLAENHRLKAIGKTRNSHRSEERWFQIEFADGKPRYIQGQHLLSEKSREVKARYQSLLLSYEDLITQIGNSRGSLGRYMGFYTLGQDCSLQPHQVKVIKGLEGASTISQRVQDLFWGTTAWAIWTDGTHIFKAAVDSGRVQKYKPAFMSSKKYNSTGPVQLYRLDRIDPPGVDTDMAITGFAENGKLLLSVQLEGSSIKFRWATRCNSVPAVKQAVTEYYKNGIERLSVD